MFRKSIMLVLALVLVVSMISTSAFAAGNEKVQLSKKHGTPEFVSGKLTVASDKSPEEIAFGYLNGNKDKFKFAENNAKNAFVVQSKSTDKLGYTTVRMQQVYKGIPVFGSTQALNINKDGVLTSVSGATIPNLDEASKLKLTKRIGKANALAIAEEDLGIEADYTVQPTTELVIYALDGEAKYTYLVNLSFLSPEPGNWDYFIDATNGNIVNKYNKIDTASKPSSGTDEIGTGTGVNNDTKQFTTLLDSGIYYLHDRTRGNGIYTYDVKNGTSLSRYLWEDSDNVYNDSYDAAAVDAHYFAAATYDYYWTTFGRDSYDDRGAAIKSNVHYYRNYNNAFWDGQQMVYGDGDGSNYKEFSGAVDVVAHEITHAVTEKTARLAYQYESGALNESMSDVFGTAVEYFVNNSPDWLLGEDIIIGNGAFRSMSDPTKYGDPDHYSTRYTGSGDNGGVHINSGIMNKVAYLVSEGGNHYGVSVSGIGMDKMAAIWYRTLTNHLTQSSTFSQMRAAAVQATTELYGSNGAEIQAVNDAFDSVGVY